MKKYLYLIMAFICLVTTLSIYNPLYADIDSGMVGHWKFDEGNGTDALDSTSAPAYNNHGTLKGDSSIPTLPVWIPDGIIGTALEFNGSDTYVEIPFHTSLDLTNNFTLSLWLKDIDSAGWLISKGVYCSGPRAWAFSLRESRFKIDYSEDGSSIIWKGSRKNIFYTNNKDDWHHGVFVYEDGTARLYMDGDLTDSIVLGQDMYSNTRPVRIGHFQCSGTDYWAAYQGAIDEVRLYDRVLDNDDVLELYIAEKYNNRTPLTDINPPSIPAAISVENIYATRVDISWPVSTDAETDVKQYEIYRDGVHIATHLSSPGAVTEYYSDLINVEPSTTYSYTVSAVDTAGNESLQSAAVNPVTPALTTIPVFPGAEGFGSTTVAGSGRSMTPVQSTVYIVDNLSASGPGSLKACVEGDSLKPDEEDPRVCVFETSGTIQLSGGINISKPYITIAGQTAPPPGITLAGDTLNVGTHDVLVRHIRVRSGDRLPGIPEHRDSMSIAKLGNQDVYNVVVDHCSFSWAMDETVQFWYAGVHDVTISNSISSEALHDSLHEKGPHSKGLLVGPYIREISIIRNLLAHNDDRNPLITQDTSTLVINNLIYNPGWKKVITLSNAYNTEPSISSIIGNTVIPGSDTHGDLTFTAWVTSSVNDGSRIFVLDNICDGDLQNDPWSCVPNNKDDSVKSPLPPLPASPYNEQWPSPLTIIPGLEIEDYIINNVGARPADRGPVDARIINEVINRTGYIIDCVEEGIIYYPTGTAQGGNSTSITLATSASAYDNRYNGQEIEITGGTGSGQTATIIAYTGSSRYAQISAPWQTIPDSSSIYRIVNVCNNGAPEGWTPLDVNTHSLTLPANKDNDDDSDGYTNLEEWLHLYADSVEGNLICTDNDGDGIAAEGGPCEHVHNCPSHLTARINDTYYSSLDFAYREAEEDAVIQIRDEDLVDNLVLDLDKSITLSGGHACDYASVSGVTSVKGSMEIVNGIITIENFVIK